MKRLTLNTFYLLILIFGANIVYAQSLVDDAGYAGGVEGNIFAETIKTISNSKKIFILTNNNQQLNPGDFISLALDDKLAARALVAKSHQGQVGIKILKIYSLTQWGKLRRNQEVKIVKGDDSSFETTPIKVPETTEPQIVNEEDLYTGDVVLEDELTAFDDNKFRNIKPDNVISIFGASFEATQTETEGSGTIQSTELGIAWAYQFSDNIFIEGAYGRAMLNGFPGSGSQTLVNHLIARLKYNFKGPLYTYFMPYAGFHTFTVSSPDAGITDNEIVNDEQLAAVERLKRSGPVFGVTVLRRLVPGWFIRADLGTDIINVGFAIEF